MEIHISDLTIDPAVQLQARGIDQGTVQGYVEALTNDAKFPPVVAYRENGHVWLADGFHRVAACRFLGLALIDAEIRDGTRQDAMVYAATANAEHGKPMSRAEKQEAGLRLLQMTDWSQERIARELAVGIATVSRWASTLPNGRVTVTGQDGRQYNTSNIGRQAANDQDSIVRCPTCSNLYDAATFSTGCPYCFKRANNITEWVDGLPEMMEQRSQVDYIPAPHTGATAYNNHAISDTPGYDGDEWYTPAEYVEAARQVMGGIDLDPASCDEAQETVGADAYYTKENDGLVCEWWGRVFLNPPYSMPMIEQFAQKAIDEYDAGRIEQAIVLVNNCTDTRWFHSLISRFPACFTRGRVPFWRPNHENFGTRQGQAFFYLGNNEAAFVEIFARFGAVVKRYDDQ